MVDVFDMYDLNDSITSAEIERCSQSAVWHRIYHVNKESSITDRKKYCRTIEKTRVDRLAWSIYFKVCQHC